jgi:hypothetical protein
MGGGDCRFLDMACGFIFPYFLAQREAGAKRKEKVFCYYST